MAKDIDVLIERGDKQLAEAHKLIADHKNNSRSHLFDVLGREIKELEYKLAQMKTLVKNATKRTSKINYMQEGLLSVTNRIGVELEFVEEVYANHNAANKTANELIEFGEKLVTQAKAEIAKHQGHDHFAVRSLEYEVRDIERAIKSLQAHSPVPGKFNYTEQTLVRHEKTLRALLARLQQH